MTEQTENLVLEILRHIRIDIARLSEKIDLVDRMAGITGIEARMTALEERMASVEVRLGKMERRVDRIERRLELTGGALDATP